MTHKLSPFAAGIALCCTLLAASPGALSAPENEDMGEASSEPIPALLPFQELTADTLFLLLLGEIAGSRGDLEVSVEAYLHAARQTRDPRVARRATEIALVARDMESATSAARIWQETDPDSEDARRTLAGILAARGDQMNEVQIELARILANSQDEQLERNLLGLNRALAPMPDQALAREIIERLVEPYLDKAPAHLALAQAAATDDDPVGALGAVERALELRPNWEAAVVLKSQLLVQMNAIDEALYLLRGHLAQFPDSRSVSIAHARTLVSARDFEAALAEFRRLLAANPEDRDLMYAVGLVAAEIGEFEIATEHFQQALEARHPEADAIRMNLGRIAEDSERPGEALDWYYEVGTGGYHTDAQIRIAHILANNGAPSAALRHLQDAAAEAEPEDAHRMLLAEVLLLREAQRFEEAFERIEQALANAPEDTQLLYESAMLAERLDRLELMEQRLRTVLELDPDHAHAYNALGYTLADRGLRLEEAEALIRRALELAPDDPFILDSLGWVRFRRNDAEEALHHLERAFSLRPDPEIAAHLGEVLWSLERYNEASELWDAALEQDPTNHVLGETLERLRGW
ncbi:MAG: tetratricopeptide repeat protein [Azoarcus sp.]|nr:tetratricopeptide repeat protein [Azoarcus sp.]